MFYNPERALWLLLRARWRGFLERRAQAGSWGDESPAGERINYR